MKALTAAQIRQSFLKFFEERGHTVVSSSSLVPDDPTLLLVNAGMVQFKNAFLGLERRPYTRATSCQKCMRVSGKHNDLEEVGPSPRHHTFFEMLGNFSFGDYFKREAIHWAWELLTKEWGIPPERLIITVHEADEEAPRYWLELPDVREDQVLRMGDATNFWSMGDVGPCGPTSELHYDWGPEFCTCKQPNCSVALDNGCGRWLEVWNLVFMQYDQAPDGTRTPLPKPGVDTGMGLERIASVLQNTSTNYDTDLFQPLMRKIRELTGHSEPEMQQHIVSYRVIADHSRAMTFLIADGVVPGNEERSYVLRMLIRRAIRFGKKLGLERSFLGEVAQVVIDIMGDFYPELRERREFILKAIAQEEERFERTYQAGMAWIEQLLAEKERKGEKVITGEEAFFLHDTHGFHIQIIEDIARERGFTVDRAGFEREMQRQKERSKQAMQAEVGAQVVVAVAKEVSKALRDEQPTKFVGYDQFETEAEFRLAIDIRQKSAIKNMGGTNAEWWAVFDSTPFYAESGGQVADNGWIENLSRQGKAKVLDVQRDKRGIFLHKVKILEGEFHRGDRCHLKIDVERRKRAQRNHTATHILHAALRRALGYKSGIQAGSLVAPSELRFDFTHFAPLSDEEIERIEDIANRVILADLPVQISYETLEEAKAKGAMALFLEDYQGKEKVRVVTIVGEDGTPFSVELCGGTHVKSTGEIGLLRITREEGVSAGVRRVYVATGDNLLRYLVEKERLVREAAAKLRASEGELLSKLEALLAEKEALERELAKLKKQQLKLVRDELLQKREHTDGFEFITAKVDLGIEELKELADLVVDALGQGVVLLGSEQNGRAVLVAKVSDALTDKLRAGDLVREAAQLIGGKGGGNPRFAQGGGPQASKLDEALAHIAQQLKEKFSSENVS
jgi:alanyl-tRNA synthetase